MRQGYTIAAILCFLGVGFATTGGALGAIVSIPNAQADPGTTVEIPVTIDNAAQVAGVQCEVEFDVSTLQVTDVQSDVLTAGWMIQKNLDTAGRIEILALDPSLQGLPGTEGCLVRLVFTVVGSPGTTSSLTFRECILSDKGGQRIPAESRNGIFVIPSGSTPLPTLTPTPTPTGTPTPGVSPVPTPSAEPTPTVTAAPSPTMTPTPDPTLPPSKFGSLKITLIPEAAIQAGGQWRVDAGPWRSSGETADGLSVGLHTVSFRQVTGWRSPQPTSVQVERQKTTEMTGGYIRGASVDKADGTSDNTSDAPANTNGKTDPTIGSSLPGGLCAPAGLALTLLLLLAGIHQDLTGEPSPCSQSVMPCPKTPRQS